MEKTNAMRMLEARKIPFETYTFDPDIHSADGVAEALGLPAHQAYKTLVGVRQRGQPLLLTPEAYTRHWPGAAGDPARPTPTPRAASRPCGSHRPSWQHRRCQQRRARG